MKLKHTSARLVTKLDWHASKDVRCQSVSVCVCVFVGAMSCEVAQEEAGMRLWI